MKSLYYIVEEKNYLGVVRSVFYTPNPWQALAEWLLKTHKPVGLPPGVVNHPESYMVRTDGTSAPVGNVLLNMSAHLIWKGQELRAITISTDISFRPLIQARSPGTAQYYMKDSYMAAVTHIRNRMKRFSRGELDVGYVLAHCAGRNFRHNFWRSSPVQSSEIDML